MLTSSLSTFHIQLSRVRHSTKQQFYLFLLELFVFDIFHNTFRDLFSASLEILTKHKLNVFLQSRQILISNMRHWFEIFVTSDRDGTIGECRGNFQLGTYFGGKSSLD